MTTKQVTVHGHTKTVGGKVVWVPEHHRTVEVALEDEFHSFFPKPTPPKEEPKPAAPAPAVEKFTPTAGDINMLWVGHNYTPGHDKVYKAALVSAPDGSWHILAQYGKTGKAMSQIGHSYTSKEVAWKDYQALLGDKKKKGYVLASEMIAKQAIKTPWEPINIHAKSQEPVAPAPKPEPPAPPPVEPAKPAPIPAGLGDDFAAVFGAPHVPEATTPKPAAGPAPTSEKATYVAGGGLVYGKAGQSMTVTFKQSGVTPTLRLKLEGQAPAGLEETIKALGGKWMPIAKAYNFNLNGKPWASGKLQAQQIHSALLEAYGEFNVVGPTSGKGQEPVNGSELAAAFNGTVKGASVVLKNGVTVGVGTQHGAKTLRIFTDGINTEAVASLEKLGFKKQAAGYVWKKAGNEGLAFFGLVAGIINKAKTDGGGLKVGDTKVEDGKTYVLNANHRWELKPGQAVARAGASTEAPKPTTTLPKAGAFSFKQVGPQKGSNPGGLFEDWNGKKWYIKFPQSEDHAKNELLASKLYQIAGVKGPKLKLVNKDGKVGIASRWEEGLAQDEAGVGKAMGALEGFVADAWLGNWDVAGASFDNLLKDAQGGAVRIDVGGALVYRAQGTPKGAAFGSTVHELESLRDASTNPQTAKVFKGITKEHLIAGAVKVLEIPNETINEAVMKFGPGTQAERAALAAKLIARKAYIAAKFPEADAIANPPKPDPHHLKVDVSQLPTKPDFANYNGPGKGLSSVASVNEANQAAVDQIYATAMAGDLIALKNMKLPVVDKATGAVTMKTIEEHPGTKVKQVFSEVVQFMDVLANPGAKLKSYAALDDLEDASELSEAFPSKPWGINPGNCDPHENLGYWMAIGQVAEPDTFKPKVQKFYGTEAVNKGFQNYKAYPSTLKSYVSAVQSSGGINHAFKGDKTVYGKVDLKQALKEAYAHASEQPEGTTVFRWMDTPPEMMKQLKQVEPGLVFQNTDSMCCSKNAHWGDHPHFDGGNTNGMLLTIRYAKGAKALDTFGSGGYSSEEEVTTLPGARFMVLKRSVHPSGKMHLEVLLLPPDPSFLESVDAKTKKGIAA